MYQQGTRNPKLATASFSGFVPSPLTFLKILHFFLDIFLKIPYITYRHTTEIEDKMALSPAFIQARIDYYTTLVDELGNAVLALKSGQQSYKIDTGQTSTSVTYVTLQSALSALESAEMMLERWCNKQKGRIGFNGGAAW